MGGWIPKFNPNYGYDYITFFLVLFRYFPNRFVIETHLDSFKLLGGWPGGQCGRKRQAAYGRGAFPTYHFLESGLIRLENEWIWYFGLEGGLVVEGGLQDACRKRRAYSRDSISLDWKPFWATSPSWRVESHKQFSITPYSLRVPVTQQRSYSFIKKEKTVKKSERRMVRFLLSHAPRKPKACILFGSPPLP